MEAILKELDRILPVVVRVHGDHHAELKEVGALYEELKSELEEGNRKGALSVGARLREVTGGFEVPDDACPTYEKTYKYLETVCAGI